MLPPCRHREATADPGLFACRSPQVIAPNGVTAALCTGCTYADRPPRDRACPCRHRGPATGQTVACPTCHGTVALKLFACALHAACTIQKPAPATACCATCPDHTPPSEA